MSVAARTVGGQRHFLAGEQQDVDVGVDENLKVHPAGLRTEPPSQLVLCRAKLSPAPG
jgi:hypothetical protein